MKKGSKVFTLLTIFSLALFLSSFIVKGEDKLSEGEIKQKINTLQIPFIANEGQTDEKVGFYAHISGGSVFVTKDGEIVYSLPDLRDTKSNYSSGHGYPSQDNPSIAGYILHGTPCNFNILHRTSYQNCSCYYLKMPDTHSEGEPSGKGLALKEEIIGGKVAQVKGEGRAVTKVNYFQGKDASQWKSNIPTYEAVNLGEVYEGIEFRLKAYGNNVEKLFYVKPGADPGQIKVRLSGVKLPNPPNPPLEKGGFTVPSLQTEDKRNSPLLQAVNQRNSSSLLDGNQGNFSPFLKGDQGGLLINEHGELEVETELGPVKFTKPVAYQEIEGKRVEVAVEYSIQNTEARSQNKEEKTSQLTTPDSPTPHLTYGFTVASYDTSKELIIDPLLASTYLGGSGYDNVPSIAIDSSGNIYVAGHTTSLNFPTTAYVHNTPGSYNFTFVLKFNSDLTTILVSTYIAGSADDNKPSIAIDSDGNICVAGTTSFPEGYNTFISKLNSDLTSLLAFTYLPGGYKPSIAIDPGGNIYVAGHTGSTNFPTTAGAYDTSYNGSYFDIYVSKFNSELTSLLASTYLGGSSFDTDPSIAIDPGGNIYVAGHTESTNFPTTPGAYDTSYNSYYDTFVSKFNSDLTTLLASTYIGESGISTADLSIAIDPGGNIYVADSTWSSNFPTTPGAYDTSFNGYRDIFVSKFNSDLTSLLASTYLGGPGENNNPSIAIDSGGNIYVTGWTYSSDFPITGGAYDTSSNGGSDIFVSKLNSELTSLLASTYLGGAIPDYASSVAIDPGGNIYVAGYTWSSNFPTTADAYDTSVDTSLNGVPDIFIAKLDSNLSAPDTIPPIVDATNPISNTTDVAINTVITATFSEMINASTITPATFTVNDGNSNIIGTVSYTGTTATFTPSNDLSYSTTYTATITTGVKDIAGNALSSNYSWSFATGQNPNTAPVANAGNDQSVHVGNTVTLDGSESSDLDGNLLTYNWTFISKPGGSSATLSDSTLMNPTFTVDKAGTYKVSLVVNDGVVDSIADTVLVSTMNVKPVANAGAGQSVYVGSLVTLDGSGSTDPDGDQLTYNWTFQSKPQNSTAALDNPASTSPTFTVDKAGTYVVSLTVNDGALDSDPDTVTISNINVAPVADAGMDQSITIIGTTVQLDGTQSYDPDGDPLTCQWAFTSKPNGSTASLANADTDTPAFTADVHGEYVVQLIVKDTSFLSSHDTVVISFTNIKPVANAGTSQSAVVGDTVTINGSGSTDGNGDSLSYAWTFSSVPDGSNAGIADPTAITTTFVPDKAGTYIVQLVVNDGIIDSDPNTVQVQVIDVQTAAIQAIQDCEGVITSLNSSVFKNVNMQNTLINKLNAVIANIEAGSYEDALGQLRNDIFGKTDGCADTNSPDKNDWIRDCTAQGTVYSYIQHAIMVVEGLIASN
ncbi:MAG: SBBP repeat-containing protein [Candidatus Jettenia sp.]|nr:MAG: SBBP repeat-containing protein [Candidatus Jettenia sp.]